MDLLEGHELPDRAQATVHVQLGSYLLTAAKKPIQNGRTKWYESLPDKKVVLPSDIEHCPDIFFYFADEDDQLRRHSFVRLKAKDILCSDPESLDRNNKPRILKLREERSLDLLKDDEFPGFLYARVQLFAMTPPKRVQVDE